MRRKIPNYKNYTISVYGVVINTKTGNTLKPYKTNTGHLMVSLCENNKKKNFGIHRLVLMAFIGMPQAGHEASHLDGDTNNNHISNLKWETHADNMARKIKHGTINKTRIPQLIIDAMKIEYNNGSSFRAIGRKYNYTHATVARVIRR